MQNKDDKMGGDEVRVEAIEDIVIDNRAQLQENDQIFRLE